MAVLDFHPSAVGHITHLATAIEVVDQHVGTVHHHMGAIEDGKRGVANVITFKVCSYGIRWCIGGFSQHLARIAAAIHGADAASRQGDGRQASHVGSVVTTEERADVVDARAVPLIASNDLADIIPVPAADSFGEGLGA